MVENSLPELQNTNRILKSNSNKESKFRNLERLLN
jgi:hypothetical protein